MNLSTEHLASIWFLHSSGTSALVRCPDTGTQKSVVHATCNQDTAHHVQITAEKHGWIATLHHQITISQQLPCSTNATQTGNLPSHTVISFSSCCGHRFSAQNLLPRTKLLALWLLIEHISIYDSLQMLAQCPFPCTHLPTKKQPKRQENQMETGGGKHGKVQEPTFLRPKSMVVHNMDHYTCCFQVDINN